MLKGIPSVLTPDPAAAARIVAMLPNGRGGLYRGRITIDDGRIVDVSPVPSAGRPGDGELDFTPHVALPGFIDLQINGAFGHDITTDPSSMWAIGEQLLDHGVTSFLPTVITSPPRQRGAAYDAIRARPREYRGAEPLGLHIEGPELAPEYAGTHPRADLTNGTRGLAEELLREADAVALVTVAPEIDTAMDSIPRLVRAGVSVSLGHTAATAAQTIRHSTREHRRSPTSSTAWVRCTIAKSAQRVQDSLIPGHTCRSLLTITTSALKRSRLLGTWPARTESSSSPTQWREWEHLPAPIASAAKSFIAQT